MSRSEAETILHFTEAQESNLKVCGVKGISMLSKIVPKFIISTAVDIMRAIFKCVSKKMIELWFDANYSDKVFSVSSFKSIVDERLDST